MEGNEDTDQGDSAVLGGAASLSLMLCCVGISFLGNASKT